VLKVGVKELRCNESVLLGKYGAQAWAQ